MNHYYTSFLNFYNLKNTHKLNVHFKAKSRKTSHKSNTFIILLLICFGFVFNGFSQSILINPNTNGGFENGTTFASNGWIAVNSTTDSWQVGNVPIASSGNRCAFMSSNAGTNWDYSQFNTVTHLYKNITIPPGEGRVALSFKWKANGEGTAASDFDNLKVFLAASNYNVTNNQVFNQTQLSGLGATNGMYKLNNATWNTENIVFQATPGVTYKLIFSWKSDNTIIANPPAALDDISVTTSPLGNYSSITSGPWSSPATWNTGIVPTGLDNATISSGHTVTIDDVNQAVNNLIINGVLNYGTVPSFFNVNNFLLINGGGLFNVFDGSVGKSLVVSGNITNNGTMNVSVGATTDGNLTLNGSTVQTVSGSGTFNSNVIRNLTFSNTNTTTPNVYWLVNNVKVAYNLNLTGARINLGTNKMIFGNNASGNTLTAPNGTGFLPSGKFSRWWTTTATGSAVTANADPTTTTSRYPFIAANGDSRAMYISRTNATAAVAGELAVTYNDATSITQNLSVSDAGYQITERFNGNWLVSNEGTSVSSSSYRIVLIAQNALATSNGNVRVMNSNAPLGGNHQSGTSTPGAQRINVSQTDLLAAPLYIGINSSDLPFISIASGNWNSPATWNKNTVPSCTDVVTISAGTAVTINSSGNSSKIINILETGQLSVTSGDLTIGCTLNNNSLINQGTLSVSGGMLNINGNFSNIATASFNQSGGTIVVDGNNNGLTSSSVLTGTPLVHLIATTPANLSLTGGTLQIIDPHVGNALANYALLITQGGGSNLANPSHTVAFGNGISTNAGGNTNGFYMNLSDGLSNFTLGSVNVNALNGTNRFVKTLSNVGMLGNLSIISGEYRVSSPTYVAGNINNNGILTSTAPLNLATWSNNVGSASDNNQIISGSGTFRNSLTSSTASFINLTVNNINSSGINLMMPLSVSGTLNMVTGIINTTNSSVLTLGTSTSMGVFQGTPGPSTMISGPFARTISNLNSDNILFPVGKVNAMPVAIAPKTTSVSVFKIEAFNTNTGTIDASINSLANKRWEISKVSGTYSTIDVQLTENSISANSIVVQAASSNGIYGSAFGSTATFYSGPPPSIQSDLPLFASNFTGFISYAKANPCSGTPLPGATLATQSTICFGQSVTLSLQNMTAGTGISYVWKTSLDGTNYSIVPNANTAILTVLPSQTSYYFAEVICINGGIMGSSTPVQITFSNNVSSISNGIRCGIGSVTLSATPSTGATISWYANPVGGIELASGTTFETPSIASTTTYYASANTNSSAGNATIGTGTELTNTTSQNSVFCNYWANGWRQIVYTAQELNAAGLSAGSITSLTFNIASLPSPATVNNFAIRIGSTTNTSLSSFRNTDLNLVFGPNNYTPILGLNIITLANPYLWDGISNILIDIREDGQFASANSATYVTTTTTNTVIHGFSPNGATLNPSYYTSNPAATASNTRPNITFSGQAICSSPRVPVVATINVAPTVALNEVTQTICSGSTSNVVTLTSNPEDFNTYVWTPSTGVSGNQTVGWTFNPILSTSYTLTATQTSGSLCASNTTLEVIVNEIPSAINFTNTPPQICKDEITVLNVTGGTLASVEILNQNFNSPSNNWTTINASSGGTVGNATWTLRPNGHLGMNSNDNSQFYLSNSDSQGSGSITNTYLESPSFSTLNFSTVGLKFFHYYRNYSSTAKLQYSVNDGSWVDFKSYTTADVGTATNFSQENIQLPLAATNQANVKIRFYYNASWGYYWAIDNVTLTGTQFPNITWSPASNLYTDVAATVPYIGGTSATTLYFKSNTSGNATVTASTATALGCSVSKSINVNVKPSPTLVITNPVINCNGGTVDLTNPTIISGSTNIATLDFYSNAAATIPLDFPTNVTIGTYYFKATSSGGCTTIAPVTVTQTPALNVLITNSTSVTCNGLQNGSATAAASGGTAPYTYSWSNGTNGATATGLAVSTYTVTTTDAKGCTATKSITITQPTILTVTINPQGSILCNGGTGSSTTAIANGGTAPYTYLWSNGASTPTITSLVAGTYTCIVTDANGCSKTNAITITQPTALSATITNPINVSCNGGFDGGATISTTGGTAPYTYLWSNGATTASVSGLSTGQFTVTVFDANGCSVTKSVTITAPTPIVGLISSKTDVTCNGLTNGTATASASGGTAPYSYLWSFGPSTATISGIGAGTRTVIITDAKGCTTAVSVTINQPAVLIANTTTTNVGCNGSATGTATISATGGTAPYTYLWSTGATNTTINNLGIGTYTVTVTDAKGCTTTTEATVNGPTPLLAIATTTNLSCTAATATASVTVTGGTSPYTYLWNNGATTATISGLSAGIFTVTILDANGCTATASTTVYSFVPLVATASATPIACNGAATGTASVSVTGGTGPYTYLWNNGGTAATIPGLAEGSYSVTITDTNNCTATTSVNITAPALLVANVTATTIQCNGDATGTATISATGGTAPYTYLWNTGATTATINNLESGIYTVNVTDANNCSTNSSITITESSAIDIQFVTTEITCNNSTNGSVSVLVSGGASPYIYTWNTGAITPSITGIGAGIYTVTILDANGCISTSTVVVSEPSVLTASATSTNVSCAGTSNGSATVVANGGTAPYTYLWSNGSTSNEITSLISGIYTVTVIDSKGCITTNSVTISQETAVTLVITNPSSTCGNVVDITSPTITLGSDAGLTFTYFTDAAATMPLINPSSITTSGTYYIKGTAAEGCATTAPIIVEINTTPTPSGISVQDFTTGQTLADFTIIGQNIIWYTNATGMETLPITTLLVSGTTYYASQTLNGCESNTRLAITAGTDLKSPGFEIRNLRYYPNPVKDILTLQYSDTIDELHLFNMLGQLMFIMKTDSPKVQINMISMASGNYILQITAKGNSQNIKIIKE